MARGRGEKVAQVENGADQEQGGKAVQGQGGVEEKEDPGQGGGAMEVVIYRQKQPRNSHKRALGGRPIK